MKIIGQTKDGLLLSASEGEIEDILKASGAKGPEPEVGDTVPVANYIEAEKTAKGFTEKLSFERADKYINKVMKNFRKLEKVFKEEEE